MVQRTILFVDFGCYTPTLLWIPIPSTRHPVIVRSIVVPVTISSSCEVQVFDWFWGGCGCLIVFFEFVD
jgi:hypothetical protein